MPAITIGTEIQLSLDDVCKVARGSRVAVSSRTLPLLRRRRKEITDYIKRSHEPAYGFNRGFGHNAHVAVKPDHLIELQKNLIRSHACGSGPALPREQVRAAMLLRAHSLAQGHSGIRPELVQALVNFLNADLIPYVPRYGSVGASGDLSPLSHIALALMGEGRVFDGDSDRAIPTKRALKKKRLKPIQLQMKEGLALNNGVQVSNAIAVLAHEEILRLLKTAALITALDAQVMLGSDGPFEADLHELRPHPGAQVVSRWIWRLMQGSPMRESHRDYKIDGELQDPYSLRCAGQILGACHDLIEEAGRTFEIEVNSVTDNPLILQSSGKAQSFTRIVSGGHFHGMPVAVKLYNLMQAMGIMARLSNMRCVRYVDETRNKGLGPDLIWPKLSAEVKATSSGFMVPEYLSASLTNAIWGAAMPSHLFSLSTDAGQEDHVSMSATLAVRVWETIPRLAEALAVELAFALQALAIREVSDHIPSRRTGKHLWKKSQRKLSPICEKVITRARKVFPVVKSDQSLTLEIDKLTVLIRSGTLVADIV